MDNGPATPSAAAGAGGTPSRAPLAPDANDPATPSPPRRTNTTSSGSPGDGSRNCFICLQTSEETPGESWVNACPCSLEAHENCMLQWVAEFETKEGSKKKMSCPACKGRIRVIEPYDPIVRFNDRLYRAYSRAAPPFLLLFLTGMFSAGSAYYGATAFSLFAGAENLVRWLGVNDMRSGRAIGERLGWVARFFALQLIMPGLLIFRALPFMRSAGLVGSMIVGTCLSWRQHPPRWPPTPGWAITLFPVLSLTYNHLYYEFFGQFERRLDRQLRGRPAEEEAAAPPPADIQRQPQGAQQGPGAQQPGAVQQVGARVAAVQEHNGLFGAFWGLAQAVVGLLQPEDDDVEQVFEIDLQINVGGGGDENDHDDEHEDDPRMPELEEIVIVEQDEPVEPVEAVSPRLQARILAQAERHGGLVDEEAILGPRPAGNLDEAVNNDQPAEAAEAPAEAPAAPQRDVPDDMANNIITRVLNATVSQLMLPAVCAAAGELLRVTLPTRLVTKTRWGQPGLLQQRWGRSLVGGCLFIVARDATKLYAKYRRLQVKKRRKIKNVPRRKKSKRETSVS